jgi:hypothetical protein
MGNAGTKVANGRTVNERIQFQVDGGGYKQVVTTLAGCGLIPGAA